MKKEILTWTVVCLSHIKDTIMKILRDLTLIGELPREMLFVQLRESDSLLVWVRQAREGGSDCEIYICSFSTSYHLSFLSQPLFLFQGPYMVLPLVSNVKQIATTELNISFHSSNSSFTSSIVSETLKACLTSSWSTALPGGQSASCTSVFVC